MIKPTDKKYTIYIKQMIPMLPITLVVLILDQYTKALIRRTVAISGDVEVIPGFFEITYSENTGAVFGSFQGQNRFFILISIVAIGFVVVYFLRFRDNKWMGTALGFILGGALGNLIDRILFGFVTDFIRVKVWLLRPMWWPNFNVADSAVVVGGVLILITMLRTDYFRKA